MFRRQPHIQRLAKGFPRVRGDVPCLDTLSTASTKFSPRARGCSGPSRALANSPEVFPACAGMFPRPPRAVGSAAGFPRVRGDVPENPICRSMRPGFSPRARGCSCEFHYVRVLSDVFPACAGMFRICNQIPRSYPCFPRVRGDVPFPAPRGA